MGLRNIHLFFIAICFGFATWLILWGIPLYRNDGEQLGLIFAVGGAISLIPIALYGRWFWRKSKNLILASLMLPLLYQEASACAVCFKDPNSPMVKGAQDGVLFLAVVVYGLVLGILALIYTWYRRAKKLGVSL